MPPPSAAQNYDCVDSQRGEGLLTHTQFAVTFSIHRHTSTPRHAEPVLDFSPPPIPPRPKPGPIGSWEELAHRQLRLRRMVFPIAASFETASFKTALLPGTGTGGGRGESQLV